ncbi:MAG: RsmB/NOP family class I SAM-dependent RNA methyltransferase [Pirellulaceae bacterium]
MNTPTALPLEFIERISRILPAELLDQFWKTFELPRRAALRINTLRIDLATAVESLKQNGLTLRPVNWSPATFAIPVEQRELASHLPESTRGEIYLQSLSSQLAAVVLDPQPGEQVLDLAAAPGGKAAHLATLMQNQGLLSCVEPIKPRFFRMQANLKNQGVTIAKFYLTDGRTVGKKVGPRFDRVLLDAPCSGEARFTTTDPASFATWSPRKIRETSRKQVGLIKSAFEALRPGGKLLYSTCSFSPAENECIVAKLLEAFPDQASVLPIPLTNEAVDPYSANSADQIPTWPGLTEYEGEVLPTSLQHTLRIMPNEFYEGFYLALIQKRL